MDTRPPETPPFDVVLATTEQEARHHLEQLAEQPLVALDTETFHVPGQERWQLSLVQVSAGRGPVLLVDALAVPPAVLAPLVESRSPLKVAHAARYDMATLAGAGLKPRGFLDTLRLAQWGVWLPAYGLADVVRELFGVELDKRWQRSDWKRRPLLPEQLVYAAADAHWTFRAAEVLRERLEAEGRWAQALEHALLAEQAAAGRTRRRRTPELAPAPLTEAEQQVVAALKRWRLEAARAARVPAYMVLHDRTLEQLARERPASLEALGAVKGMGQTKLQRYGPGLLEALARAGTPRPEEGAAAPPQGTEKA